MKLSFNKNDILKSLNIVMKAVPSNTTMPLLKCILIEAQSNEIRFLSNDMEMAIETTVNGNIIERGTAAIDAKIFYEIIRKLPDAIIVIDINERYIANIKCGKAVFNIPAQSPEDFPYPPMIEKEFSIGISQFTLKEMIRETIFSLNMLDNNKLMTGELFELKNNVLRIVALDGHRIAIRKLKLGLNYEDTRVIVPGKALNEVSKILSDNIEDQVKIYFSDNHILFSFDETVVYSRLIEGVYFQVDNMISRDFQTKITIDKKEFHECIERASLLVKEGDGKPIVFNVSDGYMEMSVNSEYGSMNETIEIEKEGNDIRIGFNPRFLIDVIKVIDDEQITLYMLNRKAPCYIKDGEESFVYLILPVNIL